MKVALLGNDTTYVYNLRREIIERLIREGYEVDIFGELLLFQEELKAMGCKLVGIPISRHGTNPFSDLKLLNTFTKKLKESKPDIVISYNIKPNVYGGMACKHLHIPYLPNITGLGTSVENPGLMQKLTIKLYKIGISKADCVFFQNEENHQFFINHKMLGKTSRAKVLPGSGVNLVTYPLLTYPDEQTTHFLFVARVLKEKGIDLFLSAARKYHNENVKFHICGICDDEKYREVLDEEEKNGTIIYHGEQKNMRPFFEMCSCVLHPSYYPEGMSNVLLEGAASGRPLICTDRAGCREVVQNGETGFVMPVKDELAVLDAVKKFLSLSWEERKQMGLAARRKVEREFDRQIVVNEYMKEIRRIKR